MFRIVDSSDGTTKVYCSETGKLICNIPKGSYKSRLLAVGRPIRREAPNIDGTNEGKVSGSSGCQAASPSNQMSPSKFHLKPVVESPSEQTLATPVGFSHSQHAACCLENLQAVSTCNKSTQKDANFVEEIPIPPLVPEFKDVDYSEDCITNEEFLQTLNLISKAKLASTPYNKLQKKFPLRHISRKGKVKLTLSPETKVFEDVELTSPLGQKWLHLHQLQSKHLINEASAIICIRKYDNYCRFAHSSLYLNGCNYPNLRCREMKLYPYTYRPQKSWGNGCHVYSFSSKDRLERQRTLDTGLNKRSRQLKRLCTPCSVRVKRLTAKEIEKWTKRKFSSSDVQISPQRNASVISRKKDLPNVRAPRTIQTRNSKGFQKKSSSRVRSLSSNTVHTPVPSRTATRKGSSFTGAGRPCSVVLDDVMQDVILRSDTHYIRGTTIKVADFKPVDSKPNNISSFHSYAVPVGASMARFPNDDHAYHRVPPASKYNSNLHGHSCTTSFVNGVRFANGSSNCQCGQATMSSNCSMPESSIPVIDITDDEDPKEGVGAHTVSSQKPSTSVESSYMFQCFGCNFKRYFIRKSEADDVVNRHMVNYHSVMQPELFLQTRPDKIKRTVVIEAFPGYKSSFE